jgi:hypothetical protein
VDACGLMMFKNVRPPILYALGRKEDALMVLHAGPFDSYVSAFIDLPFVSHNVLEHYTSQLIIC